MDEFILKHQGRVSLETLRDDLGIYLKLLRTSMIELINKDYADFVNLSSNLVGMDKSISTLQMPLQNFHGEVLVSPLSFLERVNGHRMSFPLLIIALYYLKAIMDLNILCFLQTL